jgi:lipoprotein-anchoring transpeptidase ErfK/SrfK
METLISSGKWFPTPPGEYSVWVKLKATRMSGGEGADYYDLPNVPYVMFFYNNDLPKMKGFSLHGAYWHNNFGHPMSHGCVNMRTIDAEKLYNWIGPTTTSNITYADKDNPGTKVIIYGKAP